MEKFLDEKTQAQVKEFLGDLKSPVTLMLFISESQQCEYCEETRQILTEVADLSEMITLQAVDFEEQPEKVKQYAIQRVPTFVVLSGKDENPVNSGVQYSGIPAGHEFTTLVNDILLVSQQETGLNEDTRAYLKDLKEPLNLKIFVTPSCPYCPQAVILAHRMALESDMVLAEGIEAMEFPDLSNEYNVSGVPHTIINHGAGELVGAAPEQHLLAEIRKALKN